MDAPRADAADPSAIMVENGIDEDEEDDVTTYQKRKRTSINYNLDDMMNYNKLRGSPGSEHSVKRPKQSQKMRGVIIGVWRDSSEPNDVDKHVIYGFIDIHDRLRTRIYGMNRRGEDLIGNIPTGAGGCWVTFPRIIFDAHLQPLNPAEIKEYVKIRSEAKPEATLEERLEADQKAVLRAIAIVAASEGGAPASKPIVHRPSLGRPPNKDRGSLPRQSLNHTPSFKAVNASANQTPKSSPSGDYKPTGIVVGYWVDSDQIRVEDKHAVYGVLGSGDCFRVKVQRVTRDGRYVDGNFPSGAGALWLHYDKVVFEPHLVGMSRPEIKEYVRIRQRDIEGRELERDRKTNELKAARMAKEIVATQEPGNGVVQTRPSPEAEVRHSARSELKMAARQQAEAEAASERIRREKAEARERQHEKSRKELALAEAVIQEAAQAELKNNLKKLNKVWVAQQAATAPGAAPSEEIKYHNGIKYERKQTGPFQGKLVSSAQILSIDGEDYVEYRVLTKPSF